jgi:hypothetical protein
MGSIDFVIRTNCVYSDVIYGSRKCTSDKLKSENQKPQEAFKNELESCVII